MVARLLRAAACEKLSIGPGAVRDCAHRIPIFAPTNNPFTPFGCARQ